MFKPVKKKASKRAWKRMAKCVLKRPVLSHNVGKRSIGKSSSGHGFTWTDLYTSYAVMPLVHDGTNCYMRGTLMGLSPSEYDQRWHRNTFLC